MNNLNITNDVCKFLKNLPSKQAVQLYERIFQLGRTTEFSDVKHLAGYPGYFRIDQGEYRIIFKKENDVILIPCVGKRNDDEVYKSFKRKQ
jgi:mRNA interferase RelE/StbE